MYELLLFVHISAAATLLGAPLGLTRNLKAALAAGKEAFQVAAKDAVIRGHVAGGSALLNLATGVGLIFYKGGFATVPKSYHMALGLMVVAVGIGMGLLGPTTKKLQAAGEAAALDKDAIRKLCKRLAMASGIVQLIWTVLLFWMIRPF